MTQRKLGDDWNAAHRALIYGRRQAQQSIDRTNEAIAKTEQHLAELINERAATKKALEELDTEIGMGDFETPAGFDKWGDPLNPGQQTAIVIGTNVRDATAYAAEHFPNLKHILLTPRSPHGARGRAAGVIGITEAACKLPNINDLIDVANPALKTPIGHIS